jgi:hypothetical protein
MPSNAVQIILCLTVSDNLCQMCIGLTLNENEIELKVCVN